MATIRDVANHCGVSAATVSHVLNGRKGRVSHVTRERVLAAVRALKYRPPAADAGASPANRRNIALVCGEMSSRPVSKDHYFSRVLDGVLEATASRGYSLTIYFEKMWADDGSAVRQSYDGRCDGVILMAPEVNNRLLPSLVERGANVTVVGATIDLPGVSYVDVDNESGAYAATKYLVGLGHRRIAYLSASTKVPSSAERRYGYERAMLDAELDEYVRVSVSNVSSRVAAERSKRQTESDSKAEIEGWGAELVASYLPIDRKFPTAFLCWNDDLARSVANALTDMGYRVPEDISVLGFDDCSPATSMVPHLSVMRQPLRQIGIRAAEITIDRAENPSRSVETVRYPVELVERDSTSRVCDPNQTIFTCDRHRAVPILSNGGLP